MSASSPKWGRESSTAQCTVNSSSISGKQWPTVAKLDKVGQTGNEQWLFPTSHACLSQALTRCIRNLTFCRADHFPRSQMKPIVEVASLRVCLPAEVFPLASSAERTPVAHLETSIVLNLLITTLAARAQDGSNGWRDEPHVNPASHIWQISSLERIARGLTGGQMDVSSDYRVLSKFLSGWGRNGGRDGLVTGISEHFCQQTASTLPSNRNLNCPGLILQCCS